MTLEVSTWTRRDRIERIASAERDRRAGRIELALASLGEAGEWPARVVQALAHLDPAEGDEARRLLEKTLDDWALESGLPPLSYAEEMPEEMPAPILAADEAPQIDVEGQAEPEVESATVLEDATPDNGAQELEPEIFAAAEAEAPVQTSWADTAEDLDEVAEALPSDPYIDADRRTASLDSPIELDELERAFAEAEAQTDEMLDVNSVAERVLMREPTGLAELDAEPLDAAIAEAPIWPEAYDVSPGEMDSPVVGLVEPAVDEASEPGITAEPDSNRATVIATLERWLMNLEHNRTGRAR